MVQRATTPRLRMSTGTMHNDVSICVVSRTESLSGRVTTRRCHQGFTGMPLPSRVNPRPVIYRGPSTSGSTVTNGLLHCISPVRFRFASNSPLYREETRVTYLRPITVHRDLLARTLITARTSVITRIVYLRVMI